MERDKAFLVLPAGNTVPSLYPSSLAALASATVRLDGMAWLRAAVTLRSLCRGQGPNQSGGRGRAPRGQMGRSRIQLEAQFLHKRAVLHISKEVFFVALQ